MGKFWKVMNKAEDNEPAEMFLYGEITHDKWFDDEVTAKEFAEDLSALNGCDLKLRINSPGGDVFAAPDTMPNSTAASPTTITFQINIVSANASSISAVIDPAGLVSVQTMTAAINTHNSDATAHSALITAHNNDATAHGAAINAHNTNASAHKTLYGVFLRQPSTAYDVGDVVYLPALGARYRLECVTAGTTGSGDLTVSVSAGGTSI